MVSLRRHWLQWRPPRPAALSVAKVAAHVAADHAKAEAPAAKAEAKAEAAQLDAEASRDAADLVRIEGDGMIDAAQVAAGDADVEAAADYDDAMTVIENAVRKVVNAA